MQLKQNRNAYAHEEKMLPCLKSLKIESGALKQVQMIKSLLVLEGQLMHQNQTHGQEWFSTFRCVIIHDFFFQWDL